VSFSLDTIGGEFTPGGSVCPPHPKYCAYLCFSHETYGVAVIPTSLWSASQYHEGYIISYFYFFSASSFSFHASVFFFFKVICGSKLVRGRLVR